MSPVDFIEIPRLSEPALSPNGRYLAYLKSETRWGENRIVDRLKIVDTRTGAALEIPEFWTGNANASRIWWSPDSRQFIFLRKVAPLKKHQAHLYDLESQTVTQLTNHREPVFDVIWQPDGSGFHFIAAEQPPEDSPDQIANGWVIPAFESNADREIWHYDFATQKARAVVYGRFSVRHVSATRDGASLIYSNVPDHKLNNMVRGEVQVYDTLEETSLRWTGNGFLEAFPQLSPDGEQLAYIASVNAESAPYYERKVFVASAKTGPKRLLADTPMEALDYTWDASGDSMFILGNTGLVTDLYHYTLATGALRKLTTGDHNFLSWSYDPGSDTHVAVIETPANPGEVYIMRDEAVGFEMITQEYAAWAETYRLPDQVKVSWRGRRGAKIEGLLVYPLDYQAGEAYPLVTITHGGPRSSSRFGSWHTTRYLPVLAAQGYMVLLPNHRGGTGYGDRFVRDMYGAYFRNAHHDVMDGIDALIDRGLADPDQLIKMGWSAGGHMVNKLITHTDRFAAASSGAGASDWRSMHGESDIRYNRQYIFGGEPWMRRPPNRQYDRDSPLKDAWKVSTPTVFFVGADDVRVPPTQSIMMYRGVAATRTPTVLYQAENEAHSFRKPANQLFKINTELAWFARFARDQSYQPVLPDAAFSEAPAPANATPEPPPQAAATSP